LNNQTENEDNMAYINIVYVHKLSTAKPMKMTCFSLYKTFWEKKIRNKQLHVIEFYFLNCPNYKHYLLKPKKILIDTYVISSNNNKTKQKD